METIIDLDEILLSEGKKVDVESFASLITLYQEQAELEIILYSFYCRGKFSYSDYMILARFIGCYKYIIPGEREILPELSDYLYNSSRYNLFSFALMVGNIQANLNLEKQQLLLDYLISKEPK